jgi:hypothetical protein
MLDAIFVFFNIVLVDFDIVQFFLRSALFTLLASSLSATPPQPMVYFLECKTSFFFVEHGKEHLEQTENFGGIESRVA